MARTPRTLGVGLLALAVTACAPSKAVVAPAGPPLPTAAPTTAAPTPTAPPTRAPRPAITLAFAGDVHFEGTLARRLARDPATVFGELADPLRAADLAIVNLESAVTDRGTPVDKEYVFRAPATAFAALREAGVDVASNANNHGMDYGAVGLQDTLAAARQHRFPLIGSGVNEDAAFSPYVTRVKGWRVAVLAATQVVDIAVEKDWTATKTQAGLASAYRLQRLTRAVREARTKADTVVVVLHWGAEGQSCPTDNQRFLARRLSEAGADVIVGSHAHTLLGDGRLGRSYVHYGLGNALFASPGNGHYGRSEVLTLTLRGRQVQRAQHTPLSVRYGVTRLLHGPEAEQERQRRQALQPCTGLSPLR